jgi:hypothetical protein
MFAYNEETIENLNSVAMNALLALDEFMRDDE